MAGLFCGLIFFSGAQQQPLVIQTAPIQATSLQGTVPQTVQVTQGQQASMQSLGHQVYITDPQQWQASPQGRRYPVNEQPVDWLYLTRTNIEICRIAMTQWLQMHI